MITAQNKISLYIFCLSLIFFKIKHENFKPKHTKKKHTNYLFYKDLFIITFFRMTIF